jgi:cytochrome c oxidase assembly protein subunit 15
MDAAALAKLRLAVTVLLVVILAEGILGSQVREMTDELTKLHGKAGRYSWASELEGSWKYLVHRSFSWGVFAVTLWAWVFTRRHRIGGAGRVEKVVLGLVLAQMLLGLVMSQVHIYSWVQVLHVGLAAILLTFTWLWRFGLSRA